MKKTTLCYCIKNDKVLLGFKKRGFGAGKWNGYGGKLDEAEDPKVATARELLEESEMVVDPKDLEQVALIRFSFEGVAKFECFVYFAFAWQGEPVETEEMRPQWFKVSELPYDTMWVADKKWFPMVYGGEKIEADIDFNEDGSIVKSFRCVPTVFK